MACGRSLLACRPRLEYRHPSLRADQISDGKIQGDARMVSPDREPSGFSANGARLRSAVQKVDGSAEEWDCIVVFPDYELTDHIGTRRKVSELQGQHPMALVLSRGGFCPKDRRQPNSFSSSIRELEVGYCRLVTISTDSIAQTNECRSGVGAHWPFLSDAGRHVQKDLDIAKHTDPE